MVMNANKALKRLAKIEALVSDVARRFSASAPHVGDVLKDLKAAVGRVTEAVRTEVSSLTAKKKAAAAPKKKTAKKKAAKPAKVKASKVKAAKAKTPKKVARVKRAVKKPAPKQRAAAAVQSANAGGHESAPATEALTESELQ
jgi:ribonuclease E